MARAIEISVWRPHNGKFDEFVQVYKKLRVAFLELGVSDVEIITGAAGKDVGNVVVIQHWKGLAENGALNEAANNHPAMAKFREENPGNFPADLISHDLYQEIED